jgi:hypothetical protein
MSQYLCPKAPAKQMFYETLGGASALNRLSLYYSFQQSLVLKEKKKQKHI